MKNTRRLLAALAVTLAFAIGAHAQRARTVAGPTPEQGKKDPVPGVTGQIPAAPPTVKAKYEGGIFGYRKKIDGTLSFDDPNRRLLFREKKTGQEKFSIPYDSIASAFADTQSKRPVAADVAGRVFPYGLPALLIKKKYRYLTLQYNDPDTEATGITSFKLENKEILASVLDTLARKAGLTQRGDIYVRRKDSTATTSPQTTTPN
jgi:hypothetical protein